MTLQLCLNSNTYHGFSLADAVEGAARAGLTSIELAAVSGYTEHVLPSMDEETLSAVEESLAARGIRAVALGGHCALTTSEGRAAFRANLGLAARLGVNYVVTGTGETHGDETHIDDEREFILDLRELANDAQQLGLRIAIETHGANYATGAAVDALVAEVGSPALGIAYDTGNTIFYAGVEPYNDLAQSLPRVVGLHLKDKIGGIGEWNFPAIGDGDLDLHRLRAILDGAPAAATLPLSIEIEFTPDGPADVNEVHEAVRRSVEALRAAGIGETR